jgi:hypothetical protein
VARADFTPGINPTLNGPHVLAVLAGEDADGLAAAVVPVISTATSIDAVTEALLARSDYADIDFAVVQFVGPVMAARLRGQRLELAVQRKDGVSATFSARTVRGRGAVSVNEGDIASVQINDIETLDDRAAAAPLPIGWQLSSAVIYQSEANLTEEEQRDWLESSNSAAVFDGLSLHGLEFNDGRRLIVDRTVLIGRNPQVGENAVGPTAVFTVNSPKRDISRTHLRISTDGERVLLEDLNSTNGTEVARGSGDSFYLEPGQPALLEDGMVVTIGDHVAFRVVTVQ